MEVDNIIIRRLNKVYSKLPSSDDIENALIDEFDVEIYDELLGDDDFNEAHQHYYHICKKINTILNKKLSDTEYIAKFFYLIHELPSKFKKNNGKVGKEEISLIRYKTISVLTHKDGVVAKRFANYVEQMEVCFQILEEWNVCFCSYKSEDETSNESIDNQLLEDILRDFVMTKFNSDNVMAHFVIEKLLKEIDEVFYDKESMEIGDLWRYRVEDNCKKSTSFVQILTPKIFENKNFENICFDEFNFFVERKKELGLNLDKKLLFVKAMFEDLSEKRNDFKEEYREWVDRIFEHHHEEISLDDSISNILGVIQGLVHKLKQIHEGMFLEYLDIIER